MKILIKSALLLLLFMTLTGCATKVWVSENVASDVDANSDLASCENYARTGLKTTKAPEQEKVYDTNCSGGGYGVNCTTSERQNPNAAAGVIGHAIGQALANAMIKKSRRKSCMKDKGYKLVHANSVSKKTDKENPEYLKIPEGIEEGSVEHTMWLNGIEKDAEDL